MIIIIIPFRPAFCKKNKSGVKIETKLRAPNEISYQNWCPFQIVLECNTLLFVSSIKTKSFPSVSTKKKKETNPYEIKETKKNENKWKEKNRAEKALHVARLSAISHALNKKGRARGKEGERSRLRAHARARTCHIFRDESRFPFVEGERILGGKKEEGKKANFRDERWTQLTLEEATRIGEKSENANKSFFSAGQDKGERKKKKKQK